MSVRIFGEGGKLYDNFHVDVSYIYIISNRIESSDSDTENVR